MSRLEELIAAERQKHHTRVRHGDEEHRIQVACVSWVRIQYPTLRLRLFAVPNGGKRDVVTAGKLKAEGALPGVADLILLKPNSQYGALLIEMKTEKGRQSESQRVWETDLCRSDEYKYVVCHGTEDFIKEVTDYLRDT